MNVRIHEFIQVSMLTHSTFNRVSMATVLVESTDMQNSISSLLLCVCLCFFFFSCWVVSASLANKRTQTLPVYLSTQGWTDLIRLCGLVNTETLYLYSHPSQYEVLLIRLDISSTTCCITMTTDHRQKAKPGQNTQLCCQR